MNYRTLPLSLMCLTLLAHCSDDATQDGTNADASVDAGKDAPYEATSNVDAHNDAPADVDGADGDSASPIDAPADVQADRGTVDATPDVAETSAPDGGDAADVGSPDRIGDAPTSDVRTSDGQVCRTFEVVYDAPGCGAFAPAGRCQDLSADACAGPTYCDCAGETFYGACGFPQRPYRSVGPCPDAGATDAGLEQ
jgi:hypothetical protein